ncbi:hypothetical protein [Rhabdochlamydiaceae symbiont of Dictyostelium giganteum]|uniref:hypothetical protein n=1 Tax=Rhabdochlamydiaceae symbiont of Dictyostelium giganteum TaxID=3342349 RepID=UPI00384CD238
MLIKFPEFTYSLESIPTLLNQKSLTRVFTALPAVEAVIRIALGCFKAYSQNSQDTDFELTGISKDVAAALFYGTCALSPSPSIWLTGAVSFALYSLMGARNSKKGLQSPYLTSQALYKPTHFICEKGIFKPLKWLFLPPHQKEITSFEEYRDIAKKSVCLLSAGIGVGITAWKISQYVLNKGLTFSF